MSASKVGILLNNIGTPQAPTAQDVGIYLKEFLMDEEILGMPFPIRYAVVNGLIVPRRKAKSAEKYQKIWTEEGSPLMKITRDFAEGLQQVLGVNYLVSIGMRYGEPSLEKALLEMTAAGITEVLLVPLYPQYARATTFSAENKAREVIQRKQLKLSLKTLPPFYAKRTFLELSGAKLREELKRGKWEHVIFSFHGLPESQIRKVEGCLAKTDCCEQKLACEKNCYRAQSFFTAREIAKVAGLPEQHYDICFQSRVGPAKWIGPATSDVVRELSDRGIRRLLVQTPSFVVDCLETLEEIAIELRHEFLMEGGEALHLLPCLNQDSEWIRQFANILMKELTLQNKRS